MSTPSPGTPVLNLAGHPHSTSAEHAPPAVFAESIASRATRWVLRLDDPESGCADWWLWCI
eukprot:8871140-Pyramimonas_sp.AAC.1